MPEDHSRPRGRESCALDMQMFLQMTGGVSSLGLLVRYPGKGGDSGLSHEHRSDPHYRSPARSLYTGSTQCLSAEHRCTRGWLMSLSCSIASTSHSPTFGASVQPQELEERSWLLQQHPRAQSSLALQECQSSIQRRLCSWKDLERPLSVSSQVPGESLTPRILVGPSDGVNLTLNLGTCSQSPCLVGLWICFSPLLWASISSSVKERPGTVLPTSQRWQISMR